MFQSARADDGHSAADCGPEGGGRGPRPRLLAGRIRHEVAVQVMQSTHICILFTDNNIIWIVTLGLRLKNVRAVHEASFLVEVCPPIPRLQMATALQGRYSLMS